MVMISLQPLDRFIHAYQYLFMELHFLVLNSCFYASLVATKSKQAKKDSNWLYFFIVVLLYDTNSIGLWELIIVSGIVSFHFPYLNFWLYIMAQFFQNSIQSIKPFRQKFRSKMSLWLESQWPHSNGLTNFDGVIPDHQ